MNTTQTRTETTDPMFAELAALPKLPASITARDMYHAQTVRLDAGERAAVAARNAYARRWGFPVGVVIPVFTPNGTRIGGVTYRH